MPDETITNMAAAYLSAKQARQSGSSWLDSTLQGVIGAAGMEKAAADPLFAQRKTEMGQAIELNALKLQQANLERTLQIQQQTGMAELAKVLADTGGTDKLGDPATMQRVWDIGSRYPGVVGSPEFTNVQTMLLKARQGKAAAEAFKATTGPLPAGAEQDYTDPNTGIHYTRRGPAQTQPHESVQVLQNLERSQSDLESLSAAFQKLPDGPEKETVGRQVEKARTEYEYWSSKAKGQQTSITTTTPEGTTTSVSIGSGFTGGAGGLTGDITKGLTNKGLGTKTAMKIGLYENAMELVKSLDDKLEAGDVGLIGNIKELKNRTLGQFDPTFIDRKTQEVRNQIRLLRDSISREIPEGGRETEAQRRDVLESLPTTGVFESLGTAQTALANARALLQSRAANYGAEAGRKPLVSMTRDELINDAKTRYDEIAARVRAGLMSKADANRAMKTIQAEHQDALRRFHSTRPQNAPY